MNLEYKHLLPSTFSPQSRVWIYQCNRRFALHEVLELEETLNAFSESWTSHGASVKGFATVFFGQFIVLMADQTDVGVSGCSTDSSVRLIKGVEENYHVSLFDRETLAFVIENKIQLLPLSQLSYAATHQFIHPQTLYFNNLVADKEALENNWIIPIENSWLKKRVSFEKTAENEAKQ